MRKIHELKNYGADRSTIWVLRFEFIKNYVWLEFGLKLVIIVIVAFFLKHELQKTQFMIFG